LPLADHQKVRVTVETEASWARRTAGLLKWTCDTDALDRFIHDPELEYEQSP
jgi:hypothetical protein